ncbi:MAG TPA: hypothetical protein IAB21_06050 [Candidatus Avelusimicrobium excrementipullorum]|nr:hypothetical protein [Candidatus Avelusimicrobium excrementipullorum]
MYRQLVALLMLSVFLCPSIYATDTAQKLAQALEQASLKAAMSNEGVMNENILLTSEVRGSARHEYLAAVPMIGKIGCKTYALAPNWVITSATCPLADITQTSIEMIMSDDNIYTLSDITISKMALNNYIIAKPQIFANENIMLVYVPMQENKHLEKVLQNKKNLRLIAFSRPENIFTLTATGDFFVHSSRWGWLASDKTKAKIKTNSLHGDIFSASSSINGTATDPLFYVDRNASEYLTAFNTAEESLSFGIAGYWDADPSWKGHSSNQYKVLTPKDLEFISSIIQKHDSKSWDFVRQSLYLDSADNLFSK